MNNNSLHFVLICFAFVKVAIRSRLVLHSSFSHARYASVSNAIGRHLQHGATVQLSLGIHGTGRATNLPLSSPTTALVCHRCESQLDDVPGDQRPVRRTLVPFGG